MQSILQKLRAEYQPKTPLSLKNFESLGIEKVFFKRKVEEIAHLFPYTKELPLLTFKENVQALSKGLLVGVVFSGGQASGGHNVIAGLFDALRKIHRDSKLLGFLNGPQGIIQNKYKEITEETLLFYRNQGGFDMIGSGRTKIETAEQFTLVKETVENLQLDGLVIVGGDDSNTNAALLAEYFLEQKISTKVIGVPKTIDGDLKNSFIPVSFGFDTASKAFSETIGSIARDALSAKKYYYFIKVMGRSASHLALECALQVQPNLTLIGEEVEREQKTLREIVCEISNLVTARGQINKDYGVILVPEGLIEFIPECKKLITELNALLAPRLCHSKKLETYISSEEKITYVTKLLSAQVIECFTILPRSIQLQFLLDRDPHGNVQVSKIETDLLLAEMVTMHLSSKKYARKFSTQTHFCGYEGRSCMPSNFDSDYCYALGLTAALLLKGGATGYMATIGNLSQAVDDWTIGGVPLVRMMNMEERHGIMKPVIKKTLVDLKGVSFQHFVKMREAFRLEDAYRYPGPIQFFGPAEVTDCKTITLNYECN